MKQRIIITGTTGFVGAHLVRHFATKGHPVIAIGRQQTPPKPLTAFAEYVRADIGNPLPRIDGDICIHCAGLASDSATYEDLYTANVLGTKHVFEAITAPTFIHISSASVYPPIRKFLKETDANLAYDLSDYGKSKLLAEQFLEQHQHKKANTVILRPRAIYGTHDRVLLPRILGLLKKKKIVAPGDLKVRVSLTHIHNLIEAVEQAILYDKIAFDVFNITDKTTYTLRAVVKKLIENITQTSLPIREIPVPLLRFLIRLTERFSIPFPLTEQGLNYVTQSTLLDIEKARKELGYQGDIDFFDSCNAIRKWVEEVSLEEVLKAEKDLPWKGRL